ncbi:unnamed protein product [Prorocentrum cordatum]|uniref:Uncharacterized protein n=1 Tax=Prorocentrum cordatum TaxID=2364126 RepID=A0ABN9RJ52_9DINO|nr:unnamed protein product [Polarella glacialis]
MLLGSTRPAGHWPRGAAPRARSLPPGRSSRERRVPDGERWAAWSLRLQRVAGQRLVLDWRAAALWTSRALGLRACASQQLQAFASGLLRRQQHSLLLAVRRAGAVQWRWRRAEQAVRACALRAGLCGLHRSRRLAARGELCAQRLRGMALRAHAAHSARELCRLGAGLRQCSGQGRSAGALGVARWLLRVARRRQALGVAALRGSSATSLQCDVRLAAHGLGVGALRCLRRGMREGLAAWRQACAAAGRREAGAVALVRLLREHQRRQLSRALGAFEASSLRAAASRSARAAQRARAARALVAGIERCAAVRRGAALSACRRRCHALRQAERAMRALQGTCSETWWLGGRCVVAWRLVCERQRRLARPLERLATGRQRWAWHRLHAAAEQRGQKLELGRLAEERLQEAGRSGELHLQALRSDLEARLMEAQGQEAAMRLRVLAVAERAAPSLRRRAQLREAGAAFRRWVLWRDQSLALCWLEGLLCRQQLRATLKQWAGDVRRAARVQLEGTLAHLRSAARAHSGFYIDAVHRCTSRWVDRASDLALRQVVAHWQCMVSLSRLDSERTRLRGARGESGARLLVGAVLGVLRNGAWATWRQQRAAAHHADLAELEQEGRQEAAGLLEELHEIRAQAAEQHEALSQQCMEAHYRTSAMEVEIASLTIEVSATRVALTWQFWAHRKVGAAARCLAAAMRASRAPVARGEAWARLAAAARARTAARLGAALWAAAAEVARSRARAHRERARAESGAGRLSALAWAAQAAHTRRLARGLSRALSCLAAARGRLGRLERARSAALCQKALDGLLALVRERQRLARDAERREAILLSDQAAGARALCAAAAAAARSRKRHALARLEECARYSARYGADRRPMATRCIARVLVRSVGQSLGRALSDWRRSAHHGAAAALSARERFLVARMQHGQARRDGLALLRSWFLAVHGAARAAGRVAAPFASRASWALAELRLHAARRTCALMREAGLSAALRRRRASRLAAALAAWRGTWCRVERVRRRQHRHFDARLGLRLCRATLAALVLGCRRERAARRLGALLQRCCGRAALLEWRVGAARAGGQEAAAALARAGRELQRLRAGRGLLLELRRGDLEGRGAAAALGAWRSAVALEQRSRARAVAGARCVARCAAGAARRRCGVALEGLRRHAAAERGREAAEAHERERRGAERSRRVEQGAALLAAVVRHRQRMALVGALHGRWRPLRWQGLLRAVDAAAAREQRRLRADAEGARARLAAAEVEATCLGQMAQGEAQRNDEARAEATSILQAVRRERAAHEASLRSVRDELRSSEAAAASATERLRRAEAARQAEVAPLAAELREARVREARADGELAAARSELSDARLAAERGGLAEAQQERALQERAGALERRVLECQAQAQAALRRAEGRAERAEEELRLAAAERQRECEQQAAVLGQQDQSIERLERALREQGEQIRREREGLGQLETSATASAGRAQLLEEQVSLLRQQLHREQAELRASERAWASDRAALLTTVADGLHAAAGPARHRRASAKHRPCGASSARAGELPAPAEPRGLAGEPPAAAGAGRGCPWHSHENCPRSQAPGPIGPARR